MAWLYCSTAPSPVSAGFSSRSSTSMETRVSSRLYSADNIVYVTILHPVYLHWFVGISREELATMLHAILQSTNTIVMAVSHVEGRGGGGRSAVMEGENREQAIRSMVDSAFRNCDITGTGKLLPLVQPSQQNLIDYAYLL